MKISIDNLNNGHLDSVWIENVEDGVFLSVINYDHMHVQTEIGIELDKKQLSEFIGGLLHLQSKLKRNG